MQLYNVSLRYGEIGRLSMQGTTIVDHHIVAFYNEMKVGEILFSTFSGKDEDLLEVGWIYVNDHYQNMGISQLLYKEFGKIYTDKFNGFPVGRHFVNPIAEYSFRKAIKMNWVPAETLSEDRISRDYNDQEQKQWNDLKMKLDILLETA